MSDVTEFVICPRCNGAGQENLYKNQPEGMIGCKLIMCCSCRGTGKVLTEHAKQMVSCGIVGNTRAGEQDSE
jgi:DnaJ-class molecular chaperone